MNKIIKNTIVLLFLAGAMFAQPLTPSLPSPSYQTSDGINYIYTIAMTDSTGTTYSTPLNAAGYLPQSLTSYPFTVFVSATGTRDTIKVIVQGRMKKAEGTYTVWAPMDTASTTFNKVDGIAYAYNVNLNNAHPDQLRFAVVGASATNRANVVCTVIAVLKKQFGVITIR